MTLAPHWPAAPNNYGAPTHLYYSPLPITSTSTTVGNPDVVTSRVERSSPIKDNITLQTKGDQWYGSHKKHVPKDPSKLSFWSSYERKYQ